jgi:predicted nuclease of predicted toxin-antitoxin system
LSPIIAKWISAEQDTTARYSYLLQLRDPDEIEIFNEARNKGNIILLTKDGDFEKLVRQLGALRKSSI